MLIKSPESCTATPTLLRIACSRTSDAIAYHNKTLIYAADTLVALHTPATHTTITLKGHDDKITGICCMGEAIVSVAFRTTKIWRHVKNEWRCTFTATDHLDTITCVAACTIDGKSTFVTASTDNTIRVYESEFINEQEESKTVETIKTSRFALAMTFATLPNTSGIYP